jgi:hypothetical protein
MAASAVPADGVSTRRQPDPLKHFFFRTEFTFAILKSEILPIRPLATE